MLVHVAVAVGAGVRVRVVGRGDTGVVVGIGKAKAVLVGERAGLAVVAGGGGVVVATVPRVAVERMNATDVADAAESGVGVAGTKAVSRVGGVGVGQKPPASTTSGPVFAAPSSRCISSMMAGSTGWMMVNDHGP